MDKPSLDSFVSSTPTGQTTGGRPSLDTFTAKPYDGTQDINGSAALLGVTNNVNSIQRDETGKATPEQMDTFKQEDKQLQDTADQQNSIGGIAAETGKDVAGTLGNSAVKFLGSAVRAPIDIVRGLFGMSPLKGGITDLGGNEVSSIQSDFQDKANQIANGDPNAPSPEHAVGTTVDEIIGGGLDVLGGESLAKNAYKTGEKVLSSTIEKQLEKKATQGVTDATISEAKKILNPSNKYTPTEIEQMRNTGQITTKGNGMMAKDIISPKTTVQHETLSDLINEGKISSSNTPQQNINAISQEARRFDSNIDELVNRPELNKPFTKNTINKVFTTINDSAKKDLTFVSGSTEEKAYNDVIGVAKEEIAKQPQNMSGLRAATKSFNARMERILGNDIYSGGSESVGNARIQAAKDTRTALNNYLADNLESPTIKKQFSDTKVVNKMPTAAEYSTGKLQGGSVFKSQLQREAQLLNAKDEISYRSRGTTGKTNLQMRVSEFAKNNPLFTKGLKAAGGGAAAALGAGGVYEAGKNLTE